MREHPPLATSPSSFPEKNYPLPLGFVTLILTPSSNFNFSFTLSFVLSHSLSLSLVLSRSHFHDKRMKR